jgi:protoheme IX farnesyltransferase
LNEAGTLFLIQFFWQFPHFWAIGWFYMKIMKEQGFMLPTGKRDKVLRYRLYTVWLLIASLLPALGYTGKLFISPIAARLFFTGSLDSLLCSATIQVEKCKSSKNFDAS